MEKTKTSAIMISDLRQRAEELVRQRPEDVTKIPGYDIQRLVHELQVHQIELEMQNEQLHQAQQEVEELLNKYFDLYELAPIGYFTLDRQGLILEANLAGANLLGEQMRYLLKRGFSRFVSEDSQEEFYFHLRRVVETKSRHSCELRLVRKDGEQFYAQLESIAIYDDENRPIGTRTTMSNITERKRMEESLRESEETFRYLSEAAFEAIAIHEGGVLLRANDQYFEMLGYEPQELLGRQVLSLAVAPEARELVQHQISSGSTGPYEAIGLRKDGTRIQVEIRAREMQHEGRKARVAAIRDITERKRGEEALRKAHDELELRVEERTAELSRINTQLNLEIEERKQAERVVKEREAELKAKAHELEQANIALRTLLKRMDADKEELEEKVLVNVKELTLPYLERLKNGPLSVHQKTCISILESNLADIVSPFAHRLSSKYLNLTHTEIHVANMVKEGNRTKEIAQVLGLSVRTVEVHRQSIRNKLGLKNRKANLRSHLLSLR
jgi:PAS domain S-box-containing protein